MGHLSRRKFVSWMGAGAAGSLLAKGCVGNPPEPGTPTTGATTGTTAAPAASGGAKGLETTKIVLGYIPIAESAPLIIAKEKGFWAKYGLTEAVVAKQANWASARDNVVIGSERGGIDGGQWQMPMPHLISEGIITNGQKVPMFVLAQLVTHGNGIAIAGKNQGKGLGLKISDPDFIKGFPQREGRKFKAAHTFPNVNQDFWIRYWLAAGGIDPDRDIDLLAVPPAETVQGMRNGTMDAFSTGDPWPYRIVADGIGFMAALTAQMWPFHPEEYLAVRADWVEKHPQATLALLQGVMEAQQWCDRPENRKELVEICSGRTYFNVPVPVLTPPFEGKYNLGDGKPAVDDFKKGPLYWKDDRGSVSYPYPSHDLWFLTETMRWNFHNGAIADFDKARQLVKAVNREDLWREAAKAAGLTADIPEKPSRGVETFFDGKTFDPENPQAYLDSLTIKRA